MSSELNIRLPPQLNVNASNLAEHFRDWKTVLKVYMLASGYSVKEDNIKTAVILNCAGPDAIKIASHFVYDTEESRDDPEILLNKLEEYCGQQQNEVIETLDLKLTIREAVRRLFEQITGHAELCNLKTRIEC